MDHFDQGKRGRASAGLKEKRVGEIIRKESILQHLEESVEGKRGVGVVLGVCSDDGVVEVDVGVGNLVEDVDGGGEVAAGGEGGNEFGNNEGVLVEIGFENLGVDLVHRVQICTLVKIIELLFEKSPTREPCGNST